MKKLLLSFATVVMAATTLPAATIGDTYSLVKSASDIESGAEYILSSGTVAMGAFGTKFFDGVTDGISVDDNTATIESESVQSFNLVSTTGGYNLTVDGKYLKFTGSNASMNMNGSATDAASIFTISFTSAGLVQISTSISNTAWTLQYNYNQGSPRFGNYKNTMTNPSLYKKSSGEGGGGGTIEPEPGPNPPAGGESQNAKFDFTTEASIKAMNSSVELSSSGTAVNGTIFTVDGVNVVGDKNSASTDCRIWPSGSNYQFRVYKGATVTISSDYTITDVTITSSQGAFTVDGNTSKTWSGSANSVVFTVTTNAYITGIDVTYLKPTDGKVSAGLAFPESTYTISFGSTFDAPTATSAAGSKGEITYTSSNEKVATVNATTGAVEILALGTTTITAEIAETEEYTSGTAKYILNVIPNGTITVAQALAYIEDGYNGEATVKGYITAITEMSNTGSGSTYGNATYFIADEKGGDPTLEIYRGYWMNGDKFVTGKEIEVGGLITVTGTILDYNGTKEFTSGSQVIAYEAPEIPEDQVAAPTFDPNGGTIAKDSQITISCETEGATIVYTINDGEIEETLAPVTLTISEDTEIVAYATKEGMTESKTITVNYTVFDENQTVAAFDFTNEAWLEGEGITLPTEASTGTDIAGNSYTDGAITISFPKNEATNKARIWRLTSNSGGGVQLRVFAGDNFTISAAQSYCITKITFNCDSGYQKFDVASGSEGTLGSDGVWTPSEIAPATLDGNGNVTSVTFAPSSGSRINSITVNYELSTGIDGIEAEDAAPVYYNLQGVRVANPEKGLYIVVKGNKAEKVIF